MGIRQFFQLFSVQRGVLWLMVGMVDMDDDLEEDVPPRYEVLYEDALRRNDLHIRIQERLDNELLEDGSVDCRAGIVRSEKLYADAERRHELRERIVRAQQEQEEQEEAAARDVKIVVPNDGSIPRHEYLYADHFRRVGHLAHKKAQDIEAEKEKHLAGLAVVPAAEVDRVVNRLYAPKKSEWEHDRRHHDWASLDDADGIEGRVDPAAGKECSERLYALAKKKDKNRVKSQILKGNHIDDEKNLNSVHRYGKPNPQVFHDLHNEHKFRMMNQWNARQEAEEKKLKHVGKLHRRSPPTHDVWQGLFEDADDRKHRDRIRKHMHFKGQIPPRRVPIPRPAFMDRGCTRRPKASNYEILRTEPANGHFTEVGNVFRGEAKPKNRIGAQQLKAANHSILHTQPGNGPFTSVGNLFSGTAHPMNRGDARQANAANYHVRPNQAANDPAEAGHVPSSTAQPNTDTIKANVGTFKSGPASPILAQPSAKNRTFHSYAGTRRFSDKIPIGHSGHVTEQFSRFAADGGADLDDASASSSRDARKEEQAAARQRANSNPPWRRPAEMNPLKPHPAFNLASLVELQRQGTREEPTAWQHIVQPQTLHVTPTVIAGSRFLDERDFAIPNADVESENGQEEGSPAGVPYNGSANPDVFIANMRARLNPMKQNAAASIHSTVERIRAQIRDSTEAQSYKPLAHETDNTVPLRELNPENVDAFRQSRAWENAVAGPKAFDAHDLDIFWRRLNAPEKVDAVWWNSVLRKEKRSHLEGVKYMEEACHALAAERRFPSRTRARFRQHARYAEKNIADGQFQGKQFAVDEDDAQPPSSRASASSDDKGDGKHRRRDAPFLLGAPMKDGEDRKFAEIQQSAKRNDDEGKKAVFKGASRKLGGKRARDKYLFLNPTAVSKNKQRRASRALGATSPDDDGFRQAMNRNFLRTEKPTYMATRSRVRDNAHTSEQRFRAPRSETPPFSESGVLSVDEHDHDQRATATVPVVHNATAIGRMKTDSPKTAVSFEEEIGGEVKGSDQKYGVASVAEGSCSEHSATSASSMSAW